MPNYLFHADSYSGSPDIVLHHDAELSADIFEAVVAAAEAEVVQAKLAERPGAVLQYDVDLFADVCMALMGYGFRPLTHHAEVVRYGWNHVLSVVPCPRCQQPQLFGMAFQPRAESVVRARLEHQCPSPETVAIVQAMKLEQS